MYAHDIRQSFEQAYEYVRVSTGLSQKLVYDRRMHGRPFEVGDKVWLHEEAVVRGKSKKLTYHWNGPYLIETKISNTNYVIRSLGKDGRRKRTKKMIHFDGLKLYHECLQWSTGDTHTGPAS